MSDLDTLLYHIRQIKSNPTWPSDSHQLTFGQRLSDRIVAAVGSWPFITIQAMFLALWIYLNSAKWFHFKWDLFPYILCNLLLSFQAAFSSPVILMSQNRQAVKDRLLAENTYRMNCQIDRVLEFLATHLEIQHRTMLDLLHKIDTEEQKELSLLGEGLDESNDRYGD